MEAMNNRWVKFGMSIVVDKLLPDDEEQADMERFASDVQKAFVQDLSGFARTL